MQYPDPILFSRLQYFVLELSAFIYLLFNTSLVDSVLRCLHVWAFKFSGIYNTGHTNHCGLKIFFPP